MLTATVPIVQHPGVEVRRTGLAVINRCIVAFARGLRAADDETLRHEAERLECQRPSPVVQAMRRLVDEERAGRLARHAAVAS